MFLGLNLSIGNVIGWLIFGLIIGAIVHAIDPADVRGGIIGTILTGIIGASIGGFLAKPLFGLKVSGFNLQSFLVALGGALLLVLIERLIFRKKEHIKTQVTRR